MLDNAVQHVMKYQLVDSCLLYSCIGKGQTKSLIQFLLNLLVLIMWLCLNDLSSPNTSSLGNLGLNSKNLNLLILQNLLTSLDLIMFYCPNYPLCIRFSVLIVPRLVLGHSIKSWCMDFLCNTINT